MRTFDNLQPYAAVRGILPDALATVLHVEWHGFEAITLTYGGPEGNANGSLHCHDEPTIDMVDQGRPWSFEGDGNRWAAAKGVVRAGRTVLPATDSLIADK